MIEGRVTHLFIHPIKSCRAMAVSDLSLVPGGPAGDRRFMVVSPEGHMLSQRTHPQLARVTCHWDGLRVTATASDLPPVVLTPPPAEAESMWCQIWRDRVRAPISESGSAWFEELLGEAVRLVYIPENGLRTVNPERARPGDQVGFADGYPLLWTNQASLDELRTHATEPVGMERFRPNVVSAELPAFAEDTARSIVIGELRFEVPKLCDRCVVTTTDQTSGERMREPLRALARFRRWDGAVWFGANLIARGTGRIRVGDPVRVLEVGPHPREAATP